MSQIGGGFLAPAKPFNVINPSGVSAEASVGALTSMKNQESENSTRMAISQQQMQAAQQQQQAEMEFQAQENEKNRKIEESRYKDETFFRLRTEELSKLYQDHEAELEAIDAEYRDAVLVGDDTAIAEWMGKKADLESRRRAVAEKLNGLKLLKEGHQGMFSKDFANEKGSLGAQFLETLLGQSAAKQQQFGRTMSELQPVLDRLAAVDETPAQEVSPQPQQAKTGLFDKLAPLSLEGQRIQKSERDQADLEATQEAVAAGTAPGRWDELATTLASKVVGSSGSKGETGSYLQTTLKTMLGVLDEATKTGGDQQQALLKKAAEQYIALEAAGADVRLLDRILYSVADTTGKGAAAGKAAMAQAQVEMAGAGGLLGPGKTPDISKKGWAQLNRMATLAATIQDPRPPVEGQEPRIRTNLLKGWGADDMEVYAGPEGGLKMEKMILDTVSVLADAQDPADLMRRLVNSDPEDDPEQLSFVASLHPDVRKILVHTMQKHLRRLEDDQKVAKQYAISDTRDLDTQIAAGKEEEKKITGEHDQGALELDRRKTQSRQKAEKKKQEKTRSQTKKYREQREAVPSTPFDKKEKDEPFPVKKGGY